MLNMPLVFGFRFQLSAFRVSLLFSFYYVLPVSWNGVRYHIRISGPAEDRQGSTKLPILHNDPASRTSMRAG